MVTAGHGHRSVLKDVDFLSHCLFFFFWEGGGGGGRGGRGGGYCLFLDILLSSFLRGVVVGVGRSVVQLVATFPV